MKPFNKHSGIVVPINRSNIDTDIIIPKQFLKRIERTGFGKYLMYDWRFQPNGERKEDFVLNQEKYKEASILLAQGNFGSGSSRENAVWALQDYGFNVIVAPSFADIFKSNSAKNGLLLIELSQKKIDQLFQKVQQHSLYTLNIDLEGQVISDQHGWTTIFSFNPIVKRRLLNGLDDVAMTLEEVAAIREFEEHRPDYLDPSI